MLLLHGHERSPVAGGGAAGGENWGGHPGDCGVRRVEQGPAARAVPIEAGTICLMKLD